MATERAVAYVHYCWRGERGGELGEVSWGLMEWRCGGGKGGMGTVIVPHWQDASIVAAIV